MTGSPMHKADAAAPTGEPFGAPPGLQPRQYLGLLIVLTGAVCALLMAWAALRGLPHVNTALRAGSLAALATALGVLPMLFTRQLSQRVHDGLLGFGAGVMLAATCFSLLIPALAAAQQQWAWQGAWGGALLTAAGLLLGAGALMWMEQALPHTHFYAADASDPVDAVDAARARRLWLFVFAIVLHNIPEGLAIGVATAGADAARATTLSLGIAIQDIPEGLVVALALRSAGVRLGVAAAIGAASGLVEPVAAVLAAAAMSWSAPLLPWGLAFAAGAMLFVVSHEVIPESHRQGHERYATAGLLLGFVLMMTLDTALA